MSAERISTNTRKARKQHLCNLCEQHIVTGEKYTDDKVVFDGDIYNFRMHLVCENIANFYMQKDSEYHNEGYSPDDFGNDVFENFKQITGVDHKGMSYKDSVKLFKECWIKKQEEVK